MDTRKTQHSTWTVTEAQDHTSDPGAVKQQQHSWRHHVASCCFLKNFSAVLCDEKLTIKKKKQIIFSTLNQVKHAFNQPKVC